MLSRRAQASQRRAAEFADLPETVTQQKRWERKSKRLRKQFGNMYNILKELKQNHNLEPAITWCKEHSNLLEQYGSTLEFELCKLQFLCHFHGYDATGDTSMDGEERVGRAVEYAREAFASFQERYKHEIQQLAGAMAFWSNISESPYASKMSPEAAWDDVVVSFSKEFCSLLGLSPRSPLYTSISAGTFAIPPVLKVRMLMRERRAEWTSELESAVDPQLPEKKEFRYHYVFVCPVSKEQATVDNPPMMLPCYHVICKESIEGVVKGTNSKNYKCPYCPMAFVPEDAKKVYFVQRHEMMPFMFR